MERVWQRLRHAPEQALHPVRRRRAIEENRGRIPEAVLFVCQGNICRSPFAAGLFEKIAATTLPTQPSVASAGFSGPGRGAPSQAIAAAAQRGVDLSSHVSHLVTSRAVRSGALVVTMSADQARLVRRVANRAVWVVVLGDLDPEPISTRSILDPWGGTGETFEESYSRIDRCIWQLLLTMADNSGPTHLPI